MTTIEQTIHQPESVRISPRVQSEKPSDSPGEGEFTFFDFLDFINPLQHIPVVSSIYRELTGDTIKPVAQVMGGALLGGPIGLIASVANVAFEQSSGSGIGETMIAALTGSSEETQIAQANIQSAAPIAANQLPGPSLRPLNFDAVEPQASRAPQAKEAAPMELINLSALPALREYQKAQMIALSQQVQSDLRA